MLAATLPLGTNSISVNYLGSGNFLTSANSTPLTQQSSAGILLLDATGRGALTDSGNGKVYVTGGAIVVDSNNSAAVHFSTG